MMIYLFTFLFVAFFNSSVVNNASRNFESFAFDIESSEYLYKEVHKEDLSDNRLVRSVTDYVSKDGKLLARRVLDFSNDLTKPDFKIEHFDLDYYEGVKLIDANSIRVYKKNSGEKEEEAIFQLGDNFVIDAGLNHYFRNNWKRLMSGEMIDFYFIAPSQLDYYTFRVYKNDIVEVGGRKGMELILEPDSFFLRLFFSSIHITYDLETKEILYYKGISNVYDSNSEIYDVKIDFTLEDGQWKD
ncbi:MAG: hypothetical protein KKA84_10360 [Bacteroidetes bacterium]|nr:hypothetical protein [Bacteroidota bacterium]